MNDRSHPDDPRPPGAPTPDLLSVVLGPNPPPFALLHRPERHVDAVEVLVGTASTCARIDDVPVPAPGDEVLVLLPYRQIAERGFPCRDDHEPLAVITVGQRERHSVGTVRDRLPDAATTLADGRFDVSDEAYADIVRRIAADEIGRGEGSNFVIRRSFVGTMIGDRHTSALAAFGRLLRQEMGAYWTFLVFTGTRTLLGASPERHVTLSAGVASMNPISGTYRYPESGPVVDEVLAFLDDSKERDELFMVVDEELKMMSRICGAGAHARGPYLREMGWLAHTEYLLEGRTHCGAHELLKQSLFAPAVTGSPVASASRVIARYEPTGRGYYSGVIAVLGNDGASPTVDSAILIRFADIDERSTVRIGVGATLVRHSDPMSEAAETRAKALALLSALSGDDTVQPRDPPVVDLRSTGAAVAGALSADVRVRAALARRNAQVSRFWLSPEDERRLHGRRLAGIRALVVDAEDDFTSMLAHQLRVIGLDVDIHPIGAVPPVADVDIVVAGPGPGDPNDLEDRRIAGLDRLLGSLLERRQPFVALCLSHQLLARRVGLPVVRRSRPNQGVQREIDLFGAPERVGFYNTFVARSDVDEIECGGAPVEVCRDRSTGEVHALRAPTFVSLQFHIESILTKDGVRLGSDVVRRLLGLAPSGADDPGAELQASP